MTQAALSQPGSKPMSGILLKEFDKASKLFAKGRLAPAREILERIVTRRPDHTGTINNLAAIACRTGDLPKALDYALRAVKLEPTSGLFMRNFGQILFQMSRYDQAAEAFRIATQLDPRDAKSHSVYGIALRHLERWDDATAASLRAIELDPTHVDAFDNLAITLVAQRDYGKALQLFHEAIRLAPRSAMAWNNLGNFLGTMGGRTAEAAAAFRSAIALDPHQALAHMNLGMALLKQGDFANGWREYEHRWQGSVLSAVRRPETLPQWDGATTPRSLLLHAEQGLGDTLHFCRYAPLVASRGHRVVLEVQPELVELVAHSLASDSVTVVSRTEFYPSLAGLPAVDAHCPLMSLPMVLGTRLENVPSAPYLHADPARSDAWRERLAQLAPGLRVGLVWAGNPRRDAPIADRQLDARRSTNLATLAPLLAVPGVSFVSLQKGAGTEELRAGRFDQIYDADPLLNSFADTAALVANLDLVICVDTSVAHLVGGMGKPVWMMSRFDGCFRWLEDRADTPWYPSMRIFRQGADRSWEPVVASLAKALAETLVIPHADNSIERQVVAETVAPGASVSVIAGRHDLIADGLLARSLGTETSPIPLVTKELPDEHNAPSPAPIFPGGRIPLRTTAPAADESGAVACKICGGSAPLFDVVDFHKSCEQIRGVRFALSGIGVWYRRCASCGFLFTNFCDAWTAREFAERIYNEDYVFVDPDYVAARPLQSVNLVRQLFEPAKATIRLLDYGAGNGQVTQALRVAGFDSDSWDPFGKAGTTPPPVQAYDLVTCFEVIEHTQDPIGTVEAIARLLRQNGIVFFSTLLQPGELALGNLDWWYVGPRNGHISIHTDESLKLMWRKVGMSVASFGAGLHVAFRDTLPDFARVLYGITGARGLP